MRSFSPHTLQYFDPYTALVAAVDAAFMRLYAHSRRNARRMARLALALVPLMVLLVGSCKGVSMNGTYEKASAAEQLRAALFPDRFLAASADDYRPAAGYVSAARSYVAYTPESLKMLTDREIGYLFGTPALTRRDADARILQYRGGPCVVDFYFYKEKAGDKHGATPVSFVDVRRKAEMNDAACVSDIIDDPQPSGA